MKPRGGTVHGFNPFGEATAPAAPTAHAVPPGYVAPPAGLLACSACPCRAEALRVVPGEGPQDARVAFVGQNPGDTEDMEGKPFLGMAGNEFDRWLAVLGINRARVYVTNLVKCFPGDTVVQGAGIERAYRRWYEGELLRVVTAAGSLTGTPNHPVLTDNGCWVPLSEVRVGMNLVRGGFGQRVPLSHPDVEGRPAQFQQLFDTATQHGIRQRVVSSDVNFHGERPQAEVDVVTLNRLLWNGPLDTLLSVAECLGPCPDSDAAFNEDATDPRFTDAETSSQRRQAHPTPIGFAEVINVERFSFAGHVYNLQTASEAYVANGFIVHNCHTYGNRVPKRSEIQVCSNMWLPQEFEALPAVTVVVPLGKPAVERLLGKSAPPMTPLMVHHYRARLLEREISIFPLPHPAYLLRAQHLGPTFRDVLLPQIRETLQQAYPDVYDACRRH